LRRQLLALGDDFTREEAIETDSTLRHALAEHSSFATAIPHWMEPSVEPVR
jgi:hypothetical protein